MLTLQIHTWNKCIINLILNKSASDRSQQHRAAGRARCLVSFCFSSGLLSCYTPTPSWIHLNEDLHSRTEPRVTCATHRGGKQGMVFFPQKNLHCSISIWISRGGQNQEERQWGVQANRDVKGMKVWQSPPPSVGVWMGLPTPLYRGFPPSPAACALITHSTLQLNMQPETQYSEETEVTDGLYLCATIQRRTFCVFVYVDSSLNKIILQGGSN